MKKILLPQGKHALVDDEDFELVSKHKWNFYDNGRGHCYAITTTGLLMHRLICGLGKNDGKEVDHVNGNGLDNRRINVRICTRQQNQWHQIKIWGKSKYKGVSWHKGEKKWQAQIKVNGKRFHLGKFSKEIDAAMAYDKAALKHFGEFAVLNFSERQLIAV